MTTIVPKKFHRLPLELQCELFEWLDTYDQRELIPDLCRGIYHIERNNVKKLWKIREDCFYWDDDPWQFRFSWGQEKAYERAGRYMAIKARERQERQRKKEEEEEAWRKLNGTKKRYYVNSGLFAKKPKHT